MRVFVRVFLRVLFFFYKFPAQVYDAQPTRGWRCNRPFFLQSLILSHQTSSPLHPRRNKIKSEGVRESEGKSGVGWEGMVELEKQRLKGLWRLLIVCVFLLPWWHPKGKVCESESEEKVTFRDVKYLKNLYQDFQVFASFALNRRTKSVWICEQKSMYCEL